MAYLAYLIVFLAFAALLQAKSIDLIQRLRSDGVPDGVSWVTDRVGNAREAIRVNGGALRFALEVDSGPGLLEMWIRSEQWSREEGTLIALQGKGMDFHLRKRPDRAVLDLSFQGRTFGAVPVDHWLPMEWLKKKEDQRHWHHFALAIADGELLVYVDGFPAGKVVTGSLSGEALQVELKGSAMEYGEIGFSHTPVRKAFRERYRNLYQNKASVEAQLVSVPRLREAPDTARFLETGVLAGATTIPGLVALDDGKQKPAFPGSALLEKAITVSLARDAESLYLAFRTPVDQASAQEEALPDEQYEVFIEPPWTGLTEYVQLIASANGDRQDLKLMDKTWDGKWTWQTGRVGDEWRGVLAFRFKESGMAAPEDGAVWGFNLFNTSANAAWSWSRRYHDTKAFGRMRFDDEGPTLVLERPELAGNQLRIPLALHGRERPESMTVRLASFHPGRPLPQEEEVKTISVPVGQTVESLISIPLIPQMETLCTLEASNERGETLYYQSFSFPTASSKGPAAGNGPVSPKAKETVEKSPEASWSAEELGEALQQSREWHGNSLGRRETVSPVLEPMTVQDGSVMLWNRRIDLKETLFARQIASNGVELLERPAFLEVVSGGRRFALEKATTTIDRHSEREVESTATAAAEGIRVQVKSRTSFDGLIWYELTVAPKEAPVKVDALRLHIPIKHRQARLFNLTSSRSGHPPASDSGGIGEEPVTLDFLREILWVGTQREGLAWMAEDLRGWPIENQLGIQSIVPDRDGATSLVIKLGESVLLKEERRFSFGLQATPVRPRMADFRKLADRSRVRWSWFWGDGIYYPFFDDPAIAREMVARERGEGREVMPTSSIYFYGQYRFGLTPKPFPALEKGGLMHRENLLYAPLWVCREGEGTSLGLETPGILPASEEARGDWRNVPNGPKGLFRYNPASGFQDYYLWKLDRTVRETGLGALYLDQPLFQTANRLSGAGYVDENRQFAPTVPLLGMRSMVERIHNLFVGAHGKSFIKWHCSNQLVVPVFPYIDVYLDGENYGHSRSKVYEFYSKLLSPEKLQVQHTGLPFGFAPSLLPEFETRYAPTPASVRDMLGLFLVHDSHVWNAYNAHPDIVQAVIGKWLDFPYDGAKTFYYWDDGKPFSLDHARMYAVLHLAGERARIIVFNWSDEVAEGALTLDSSLGVPSEARDVETAKPWACQGSEIPLLLPPRDFRMIDLKLKHD